MTTKIPLRLIEWKVVPDYPGYQVSDNGLIWSNKSDKYLKGSPDKKGYLTVRLGNDRGFMTKKVHLLVKKSFDGNTPEGMTVDHENRDKSDCRLTNLRFLDDYGQSKNKDRALAYTGVFKKNNRWRAIAHIKGKAQHIGYFDSEAEAVIARNDYILDHGLPNPLQEIKYE